MPGFEMSTAMNLSQQQRLSAQMLQTINILSLPVEELRDKIYEEVEKNPALEITHDSYYIPAGSSQDFQNFFENIPTSNETLQEHLLVQLAEQNLLEPKKSICKGIVQSLNEKGFFSIPKDALKKTLIEQKILPKTLDTQQVFDECIKIVQSFEPLGICATDIFESLQIQAKAFNDVPPLVFELLQNQELLSTPRASLIQKKLAEQTHTNMVVTTDDVSKALDFIRSLDPYPARQFDTENKTIFVSPDVIVTEATPEQIEDGSDPFIVELTQDSLPSIGLSNDFSKLKTFSKEASKFVSTNTKAANFFMTALEQRKATMYKVSCIIVKKQADFFKKGVGNLKPLTMKTVADEAEVHEATVSRISNGKYLRCKWGLFELRSFFTNSISAPNTVGSQEDISKESVKYKIKAILDEAEKQNPNKKLSDEKVSQKLKEMGINIARRTVAKYRSELSIKSSFDR